MSSEKQSMTINTPSQYPIGIIVPATSTTQTNFVLKRFVLKIMHKGGGKKNKKKVVILLQPPSIYLPTPIGVQKATFLIFFNTLK